MIAKGLFDGNLAIVDRSLEPQNDDVAMVDGERSFKVWQRQARRITRAFAKPR